jgi:hypothetical protein
MVAPSVSPIVTGIANRRNRTRRLCRAARWNARRSSRRSLMAKPRLPGPSIVAVVDRRSILAVSNPEKPGIPQIRLCGDVHITVQEVKNRL